MWNSEWQPVKPNNFKTNIAVGCLILWLYVCVVSDANLGQATGCPEWVAHSLLEAVQEYGNRTWNKTTISFFHVISNSRFISQIMTQLSTLTGSLKRPIIFKKCEMCTKAWSLKFGKRIFICFISGYLKISTYDQH